MTQEGIGISQKGKKILQLILYDFRFFHDPFSKLLSLIQNFEAYKYTEVVCLVRWNLTLTKQQIVIAAILTCLYMFQTMGKILEVFTYALTNLLK